MNEHTDRTNIQTPDGRTDRCVDGYKFQLENYDFVYTHTTLSYGGTGIYIKRSLSYNRRPDLEFKVESCETTFIELKSSNNQKGTIVGIIYRHPHENHLSFFSEMTSIIESIVLNYNILLLGDFNLDVSSSITNCKYYKDILLSLCLRNLISKPTRVTKSSDTILDHILTNLPYKSCQSGILINTITDHMPVYTLCNLAVLKVNYRSGPRHRRIFKDCKKSEFLDVFSQNSQNLHVQLENPNFDPDTILCNLVDAISVSVDTVFPL